MPRPPSIKDAKRVALADGVSIRTAAGTIRATAVLASNPPTNPLSRLRADLGFSYEQAERATGIPRGFFLVMEVDSADMSAREALSLSRLYERIARRVGRGTVRRATGDGGVWDRLVAATDAVDARVEAGAGKGDAYAAVLRELARLHS